MRKTRRNGRGLAVGLLGPAALVALAVVVAGCSDLFTVKNPGQIQDDDLNSEPGINALVFGMSFDLSQVYDELGFLIARASDEMAGSGSYFSTGLFRRGVLDPDDMDFYWEQTQNFRWVAENGIERSRELLGNRFDGDPRIARAYLFAGVANRILGEDFCEVLFDGGPAQPKSAAFERAIPHFQAAVQQGTAAGRTDIVTAAHGGLAQVNANLGNWSTAVSEAAMVPTDFVFSAQYFLPDLENEIYDETHDRAEMSAFGALAGSFAAPGDPRAPFTDCTQGGCTTTVGADGLTDHYRQEKYPEEGSDIPVIRGTDMRLIEAEARLVGGDMSGAMMKINEVRDFYGLGALTASGLGTGVTGDPNSMTVWDILDRERHLTLWLEGRRLWDLHRWDHPFLNGGSIVYPGVSRRASCIPISRSECDTNRNITCP